MPQSSRAAGQSTRTPRSFHEVHLTEHNIESSELCHRPIDHAIVSLSEKLELDCESCHEGSHEAQQNMFTGTVRTEPATTRARISLARVTCQSCHRLPQEMAGTSGSRWRERPPAFSCHGSGTPTFCPGSRRRRGASWSSSARWSSSRRQPAPGLGRRAGGGRSACWPCARENVELVPVGGGVHNVGYADAALARCRRAGARGVARPAVSTTVRQGGPRPDPLQRTCACAATWDREPAG